MSPDNDQRISGVVARVDSAGDQQAHFRRMAGLADGASPHPWQRDLAADPQCTSRLIRIPTGMGKTLGVLGAWAWHRVELRDPAWPRRLVWCLPMRVLVEQVAAEVQAALQRLGGTAAQVPVHLMMGGADISDWHLEPERDAVLVGTQDMLLSRALNRGYGVPRARWPMEFGLLNHDCLWVMDEVQLMDVGLATSAQLQSFRDDDACRLLRPCRTWWMSATLQRDWLATSPDTAGLLAALPNAVQVPAEQRQGPLWDGVRKPVRVDATSTTKSLAAMIAERHLARGRGASGPTLVVVNRVPRAVELFDALVKTRALQGTDIRLVHSRFRPAERTNWRADFLNRCACAPGTDRIIVSTQVIEAGVDISAGLLVTDLAPWPSLVQRFGRAARWGGEAEVIVVDHQPKDDNAAAPYDLAELDAAREALSRLADVAPLALEAFEEANQELLPALYPYRPPHLLLRQELDELFDTAADLSGTDIDVSRFIRSGAERDVQVFWRPVGSAAAPADDVRPGREELCAVPFVAAREWLCEAGQDRLKTQCRAWVWDWLDGRWRRLQRRDIFPGQTLLVDASVGGYDPVRGFVSGSREPVRPMPQPDMRADELADATESDESLSVAAQWQGIAFHGQQVGRVARQLADELAPALAPLLDLAGRWHDAGKAHPAFQASLRQRPEGAAVAKAPPDQWLPRSRLYQMQDGTRRAGFRHELASTLALFALLRRCRPDHPALLGPWRQLLPYLATSTDVPQAGPGVDDDALGPLERELLGLDADGFDLLAYLVCSHHGKVRVSWQAAPADQAGGDDTLRIRGVRSGDVLPAFHLGGADGDQHMVPAVELVLEPAAAGLNAYTGRGWTERVLGLLQRHGPFTLAWLEALIRAADQRASRDATLRDPDLDPPHQVAGDESRGRGSAAGDARVDGRPTTPPSRLTGQGVQS